MTFAGACECNSADQYPHLSHFCGHLTMNKRLLLYTLPLHHMEHRTLILCGTAEKKPEYQFGKYWFWSSWTGSSGTTLCRSWSELSSLVSLFSNSGGRTQSKGAVSTDGSKPYSETLQQHGHHSCSPRMPLNSLAQAQKVLDGPFSLQNIRHCGVVCKQ